MINPNDITTIRVGELPPNIPTLESKIPHELGTNLNYFTIQQLIAFLQPYVGVFQYETKRLAVNQAYITDNFDETGLGRNICLGWAIRNGNNGTDNIDGKVGIAYGASNNVIGHTDGSKTQTLLANQIPELTVNFTGSNDDNGDDGEFLITSTRQSNGAKTLKTVAGNQPHSIMQPYIIDLYIMKL